MTRLGFVAWLSLLAVLAPGTRAQSLPELHLPDAVVHEVELEASDPILEDFGRHVSLSYEARTNGYLFAYAESKALDLVLQVADEEGDVVAEDDDEGGGTTPWIRLGVEVGERFTLRVASKRAEALGPARLTIVEAAESEETIARAEALRRVIERAASLRASGDVEGARRLVAEALEETSAESSALGSPAVQAMLDSLGFAAYSLAAPIPASRAWSFVLAFRSHTLPGDHLDLQRVRLSVATALKDLGDLSAAKALEDQAFEVASRTLPEDHPDLRIARGNRAVTLRALGDLAAARPLFEKVLEGFVRALPDEHPDLQRARSNLAVTLRALGDLPGAKVLFEKVLEVAARTLPEDDPEVAKARGNLASTVMELGDIQAAKVLFAKVVEVFSRTLPEDHPDLLVAKANLAATLSALGDLAAARTLERDLLEIRSRTVPPDHRDLQVARSNLASTLQSLGDLDAARALQERVVEVFARTLHDDDPELQMARGNLAQTLHALGELPRSRELFEKVFEVNSRTLPSAHPELARARRELAWTLARSGETEGVEALVRDLVRGTRERLERMATIAGPREIEAMTVVAEWDLSSAISLTSAPISVGASPETELELFSAVETARGAGAAAARLSRLARGDEEANRLRLEALVASAEVARLAGAESREPEPYFEAVRRRETAQAALQRRLAERMGAAGAPRASAEAIAEGLRDGEAAIAYWRYSKTALETGAGDRRSPVPSYLAYVVRRGGALRRVELGPAGPIEEAIEAWRREIGSEAGRGVGRVAPAEVARGADERLRALVFDPLRSALEGTNRLVVAPAEALHLVPLDALPDGDGVLGDHFEFEFRSTLRERTLDVEDPSIPPSLLAVGGIDYDGTDPAAAGSTEEEATTGGEPTLEGGRGSLTASRGAPAAAFDRGAGAWRFEPLHATSAEIRAVVGYFRGRDAPASPPVVLDGRLATRESFEVLAPRARYIHLATHGYFAPDSVPSLRDDPATGEKDPRAPTGSTGRRPDPIGSHGPGRDGGFGEMVRGFSPGVLCGLAFAGANLRADDYGHRPGVMTAEELAAMDLSNCELAVLSACETHVGLRRGGQSIASLQQALHAAGVRTTIASLWNVPDEATRILMAEFYRRIWVLEEGNAKALWEAKRTIRERTDERGRPVHSTRDWAAWVMMGDPE